MNLLALHKVVKGATLLLFERAVHILVNRVREKDDPGADHHAVETEQLPNRVTGVLPEWRQDEDKAEPRGPLFRQIFKKAELLKE